MIKPTPTPDYRLRPRLFVRPPRNKVKPSNTKGVETDRAENSDLKSNLFRGKMTLQEVDADN